MRNIYEVERGTHPAIIPMTILGLQIWSSKDPAHLIVWTSFIAHKIELAVCSLLILKSVNVQGPSFQMPLELSLTNGTQYTATHYQYVHQHKAITA